MSWPMVEGSLGAGGPMKVVQLRALEIGRFALGSPEHPLFHRLTKCNKRAINLETKMKYAIISW